MEKLVFISSSSRELYKEDVYRALCLPEDYVLHFRYQRKYVDPLILSTLGLFKSAPKNTADIIFSSGNDLDVPEHERVIENIAVRQVEIVDIRSNDETDLV